MEIGSAGERGRRRRGGPAGPGPAAGWGERAPALPRAPAARPERGFTRFSPGARPGGAAGAEGGGGEAVRVRLVGEAGGRSSAPPAGRGEPLRYGFGNRGKPSAASCPAARFPVPEMVEN